MAFDQKTRNLLQRTVTACRSLLDAEFTAQLQEVYGIQPDGVVTPLAGLDHLGDEELAIATLLRGRLNHLEAAPSDQALTRTQAKPENVRRVIREQAFTILNRLAALRLAEERGLALECVRRGADSDGFKLFQTSAHGALGDSFATYRIYLECLFDELAVDLGVLFDRFSPMGLLFPRRDALEALLKELNGTGRANRELEFDPEQFTEIWKADETIGWIYQYYNDEAERKKMREESSAPRNSRELAVRNQFFTPRYVVEFLTDNTLGRLWYEMTRGETALRDRCRYLVRRPTETFLKPGESAPESDAGSEAKAGENLSQEDLLRQPVHIPHRPLKDPREIRLLDPACGSMHFGLYAFDLFTVIYDEAWEIAHGTDAAAKTAETFAPFVTFAASFPDKAAFLREVPRLIVEHNIHGIDIDPRAAQIAGLSLWLRAQRAWHQAGVKPADRPRITRSNLVCAEPMPGERELLREFVEQQFPAGERPAFAFLLEKIFDRMTLAGEAGSLLRIEEEIRAAIAEARALAQQQSAPRQTRLFPGDEQPGQAEFDLRGLNDEQFWQAAEQQIYDALEAYAEQAENGGGFQRRLFADDAAQGFAFIDLCRKRYDVVVMNPPYGDGSPSTREYLQTRYGGQPNDLFGCFIERSLTLGDFVGALTSRTFLFFSSFESLRTKYLFPLKEITALIDLGFGVLDGALVETCAMVLKDRGAACTESVFIRLNDSEDKAETLVPTIEAVRSAKPDERVFPVLQSTFVAIEGAPMPYWVGQSILNRILSYTPIYPEHADVRLGAVTSDNDQFLRLRWEVAPSNINPKSGWASYAKGGDYSKYFGDIHLLIDWRGDGEHIKLTFGQAVRLRELEQYLKPGLTYPLVTVKGMNVRALPANCVFDNGSPSLFLTDREQRLAALGILNSRLAELYVRCFTSSRHWQVGYVRKIPWPIRAITQHRAALANDAERAVEISRRILRCVEPSAEFFMPQMFLFACGDQSVAAAFEIANDKFKTARQEFKNVEARLDTTAKACYEFSDNEWSVVDAEVPPLAESRDQFADFAADLSGFAADTVSWLLGCVFGRWDIRYATGERPAPELPDPFAPLPVCPPGMLQGDDGLPLSPEAGRRLRTEGRYPLDVAWDGILVDDPEHPLDLERRVHVALAVLWPGGSATSPSADALEHEACALLGVPTLREWFRRPAGFFADHLKRYSKSRRQAPIYWPLSTASGSYTLWLYYHRLTDQTLYKCIQNFVDPKLAEVEKQTHHLRTVLAAEEGSGKDRRKLEELEDLRRELKDFRAELERWAGKWKPNLNDGVLITASPLWKLFGLPKWQKDLKACWKELEKGDYDWAHLAYTLWPDRVREKCETDRSLAIAHSLEELCAVKAPEKKAKKKAGKKKPAEDPELIKESE
jgi:hypothetical protein